MHALYLSAAVGIVVGIFLGEYTLHGSDIAIGMFVTFLVLLYYTSRAKKTFNSEEHNANNSHVESGAACAVFTLFVVFGILRVQLLPLANVLPVTTENTETTLTVLDRGTGILATTYPVTFSFDEKNFRALLRVPLYPEYNVGDMITISGKLSNPENILPTIEDPKPFNYGDYLQQKNIVGIFEYPRIVSHQQSHSLTLTERLIRTRISFENQLREYIASPEDTLVIGVLFGGSLLSPEDKQLFQRVGISHIVALSGFNIAILVLFFGIVLSFAPFGVRIVGTIIGVILFIVMVGVTPSILRASTMSIIMLIALMLGRVSDAQKVFLLTLTLLSVYDPLLTLHSVSFHLSLLATAGILYVYPVFKKIFQSLSRHNYFVELLSITLAATLSTLPYLMYTFGTVSPYAIILNILVVPLVPFLMLFGGVTLFLSYVSSILATGASFVATALATCIFVFAKTADAIPFANISTHISLASMIALYVLFTLMIVFIHKRILVRESRLLSHEEITEAKISF